MKWERNKIAPFCLICIAVLHGFFFDGAMVLCEAKTGDTEKEVADFVKSYYRAQTPEGIETLADYVAEPEDLEFQMSLISLQTLFEHGFTGMKNICAIAYPVSDGKHWVVPVSEEWVVQDYDVTLPGLKVEFVGRNQDGKLQIETNGDQELDSALVEEIREITLSDEVIDWNNEIAVKYNDVIADNPDIMEWLLEVSAEADQAKAEAVNKITDGPESDNQKKADGHEKRYTVKKGDCLWSIAEEQLGDGMRWTEIYGANRTLIGENPDLLYVGIAIQVSME